MTILSRIIAAEAVDAGLGASGKKALFQQLAAAGARLSGVSSQIVLNALNERERLGSTGFGAGVALPHGRIEGLEGIVGFLARLSTPVDYHSVDGLPVDLVFLLLSPPDSGADHLKALAGASRMLRDRQTVAKLRGARSRDAMLALLDEAEARDAA
jgi:PTS system nitrogen regulatory IIA component